jgi:uncharacterized protein
VILIDTGGLLAALDPKEFFHAGAAAAIRHDPGPFILSPFVLAELDYLVGKYLREEARLQLLDEVARGAYRLEAFSATDIADARELMQQYRDLHLSLADSSVVVLANRYRCWNVLTVDERHFRILRGPWARPFRLLPADS